MPMDGGGMEKSRGEEAKGATSHLPLTLRKMKLLSWERTGRRNWLMMVYVQACNPPSFGPVMLKR